jgi:hypothetical protein
MQRDIEQAGVHIASGAPLMGAQNAREKAHCTGCTSHEVDHRGADKRCAPSGSPVTPMIPASVSVR